MYNITLTEGGHDWQKQNLVTITGKNNSYDLMKCSKCGIQGKTHHLTNITLKGSYSKETVFNCKGNNSIETLKQIKVTFCTAQGSCFENLKPETIHDIITPPDGYKNDHTGVWVMGVGEPVKILTSEFNPIN